MEHNQTNRQNDQSSTDIGKLSIPKIPEFSNMKYFHCFPGGNVTYVGFAIPDGANRPDRSGYPLLGQQVHKQHPHIEQGGFLEASENPNALLRLQMAGGEFCGNATRSVAALVVKDFLKDQEFSPIAKWGLIQREGATFKFPIEVSGTSKILQAEVTPNNEQFATKVTMPIRGEYSNVSHRVVAIDGRDVPVSVVRMDGITHVLVRQEELAFSREDRGYEATLLKVVSALELSQEAAVGVMWYSISNGAILLEPVVWVKNAGTCYYESACGSGSLALALGLAVAGDGRELSLPITQPSGHQIIAEVVKSADGNSFISATISGIVELRGELEISNVA